MNLMRKYKKIELLFIPFLLICCGLFFIAGCGYISSRAAFPWEKVYNKELQTLKKGNQALKTGDIKRARSIFQNLRQQAASPVVQQKALYGLACADLALAENVTEFETALELWNQWIQQIPPDGESGDPRLLYPLLISRLAEKKEFYARLQTLKSRIHKQSDKNLTAKNQDIKTLNAKLTIKNQEIRKLEQKLDNLKTRIQTLEHQLNAMKTIDLKVQEKKKEIAAP